MSSRREFVLTTKLSYMLRADVDNKVVYLNKARSCSSYVHIYSNPVSVPAFQKMSIKYITLVAAEVV